MHFIYSDDLIRTFSSDRHYYLYGVSIIMHRTTIDVHFRSRSEPIGEEWSKTARGNCDRPKKLQDKRSPRNPKIR